MSHRAEARYGPNAQGYSWPNKSQVRKPNHQLNPHENREILYPSPGAILIGRDDLIVPPSEHIVRLYPHGTVKLIVPINAQWEQMFHDIKNGKLHGGIHLRSNMAQAQFDITDWNFIEGKMGAIEVILTNFSSAEAEIEAGKQLKLGNPYCYESPLKEEALKDFVGQMKFSQESRHQKPHVVTRNEISERKFTGDNSLSPSHEVLEIQLPIIHKNQVLYQKISLPNLASGPDRVTLHKQIGIDGIGKVIQQLAYVSSQHIPDIQLASTDAFSMSPGKALILLAGVKNINGTDYLVAHSASAVHRSEALAAGTSHYKPGETYVHRVITETYNTIFPHIYPSSILCGAFNMKII